MAIAEQTLGQSRPSDTTAVSIFSPTTENVIIKAIVVCNTTDTEATFRIFLDDDGTTYDESTALFWDATIAGNKTVQIDTYYAMNNVDGNLAVRTGTNSAITFTVFGATL